MNLTLGSTQIPTKTDWVDVLVSVVNNSVKIL